MSEPRVIQADFCNFRPVNGRKVLQLTFEVALEDTEEVLRKLGIPKPGESKWCAIALLANNGSASANENGPQRNAPRPSDGTEAHGAHPGQTLPPTTASTAETGASETRERKSFQSLPLSQQAALRCSDTLFREFLGVLTEDEAAMKVRIHCAVGSRKDIVECSGAATAWRQLDAQYQYWLTDRKFAEARR